MFFLVLDSPPPPSSVWDSNLGVKTLKYTWYYSGLKYTQGPI